MATQKELDEQALYKLMKDPVAWVEHYLKDPDRGREPARLRWYQKDLLNEKNPRKVVRMGRRTGKTVAMCYEMIWKAVTFGDRDILVVTPYQSQIDMIFEKVAAIINNVPEIQSSIKIRKSPFYLITFGNGSKIKGFTAGTRSGQSAEGIRGQDATDIYLDEVDYMGSKAISAINAIRVSRPTVYIWASSTPRGIREQFYHWCTNKRLGFSEFHYGSDVLPHWTDELARTLREECSDQNTYLQEYMAEWGHEAQGVYSHALIDAALINYTYRLGKDYKGNTIEGTIHQYNPNNIYVMGVDWNGEGVGTRAVIWEWVNEHPDPRFVGKIRVFYHENLMDSPRKKDIEFQHNIESVKRVIELKEKYHCTHVYLDKGHGHTNYELILKYYKDKGGMAEAREIYKPIDFNSKIPVRAPDGTKSEKWAKEFMVGSSVRFFENGMLVFPEIEDERYGLVGQYREYIVERIGTTGRKKYTDENEDSLTAANLGLHAFVMEYSELSTTRVQVTGIGRASGNRDYPVREPAYAGEENKPLPGTTKRGPALQQLVAKSGLPYSYSHDPRARTDSLPSGREDARRAVKRLSKPRRINIRRSSSRGNF